MSNKLLSETTTPYSCGFPQLLWVPSVELLPHKVGFKTLHLSLDLNLDLEQETRGMGSEQIWSPPPIGCNHHHHHTAPARRREREQRRGERET
ncbi:hypothetical protein YC2023_077432 [Brassica napus]